MLSIPLTIRDSPLEEGDEVCLAAFGDLMLAGEWDEAQAQGRIPAAFRALEAVSDADLVFANLEATTAGDGETISKEPRLIGQPATIENALRALGVDLISLGNNHAFDACLGGFLETRGLLERLGISYLGAGQDAAEAAAPLILERKGLRFGFLAFTDEQTQPSHVANASSYGVHPFEVEAACGQIDALNLDVDHVVVSVHWGVEYCHLPSPTQIRVARQLVDAGARLVIGHHAHVVQGVENYGDAVIAYNLGNAVTTDLEIAGRRGIRQGEKERSTFALRARFGADALISVELIPFYAGEGWVQTGHGGARRRFEKAQRLLEAGVDEKTWRRVRLYEDVVLRTLKKLHPSVIGSVRPRHFAKVFKNISGALTGRGPAP